MRGSIAIPLVILCGSAPAAALDLPARKAGLWEISMTFEGRDMPSVKAQHCIDADTDKQMNLMSGAVRQECAKQDINRVGNTIVIDSVCKFGDTTSTSHAVMSGDFNSAYTVKVDSQREGGPPLPGIAPGSTSTMMIAAKWLGACAAGQRPGDIVMGNGMKMNILDMPKVPGAPPAR